MAYETDKYYQEKQNGVPVISLEKIKLNDETGLFSPSLVNYFSINEEEYIPYKKEEGFSKTELNIDYRRFRSKPFVKLKDGTGYVVINNQILCERLFNSLYFDFLPLINGKKEVVFFSIIIKHLLKRFYSARHFSSACQQPIIHFLFVIQRRYLKSLMNRTSMLEQNVLNW